MSSIRSSSMSASGWEDIVRVKVEHVGTVRQIVFDEAEVPWTLFASKVKEVFRIPTVTSISAFYIDEDGDSIQIDSDVEIQYLLKLPRVPKLSIIVTPLAEESTTSSLAANVEDLNITAEESATGAEEPVLNPFQDIPQSTLPRYVTVDRTNTELSHVPTVSVQETQVSPTPVRVEYPTLDGLDGQSAISMHDVESVAPSLEFASPASNAQIPGSFPVSAEEPASAPEASIPAQETEEQPKTLVIDLSEIIEMISKLVERVTQDPEFMNSAVRTLHEFAASSQSHFEDLMRMFNEMLAKSFPQQHRPSGSQSQENPPRYSVVFDRNTSDPLVTPVSATKKPFIIRFNNEPNTGSLSSSSPAESNTRSGGFNIRFDPPSTSEQSGSTPSMWQTPIHFCTGITDECKHLHNPNASYTAKEGLHRAKNTLKEQAQSAKEQAQAGAQAAASAAATHAHAAASVAAAQAHAAASFAASHASKAAEAAAVAGSKGAKEVGEHLASAAKAAFEASKQAASSAASSAATGASSAASATASASSAAASGANRAAGEVSEHLVNTLKAVVGTVGGVLKAVSSSTSLRAQESAGSPPGSAPRWKYTTCDVCGSKGFTGPRYKCKTCRDYDICGVCYYTSRENELGVSPENSGGHSSSHEFTRIDHPNDSNRAEIERQVNQVMEMGLLGSRERIEELVVHFGGDLDRVVEVLMDEGLD
ncbi:hypothetical protein HDU79_011053 [Rhizoclosmatium sp. JEL0117]|nr:hypothetical protein HDU79_011053 [Rhizoclosmatium sp. JEL0117]